MNKVEIARRNYVNRLLQKGYSQIDENTFELCGSIFHLVNDIRQITPTVASVFYLVSSLDDIKSCKNCKDKYYVDSWNDGDGFYRCSITGRIIGSYEDLGKEKCDQI